MEIKNAPIMRAIEAPHTCSLCGRTYNGRSIGTLLCTYHPYTVLARSIRTVPYGAHGSPLPPTRCKTCNFYHLVPELRPQFIVDAPGEDVYVGGCTKVDHTEDVHELLRKPYACLPELLRDYFVAIDRPETPHPLVYAPEHLAMQVPIFVPGVGLMALDTQSCAAEIMHTYASVDLERQARLAKRGPVISTISRIKGMRRPDADIISRLYTDATHCSNVSFTPFFVVPRVEQPGRLQLLDLDTDDNASCF